MADIQDIIDYYVNLLIIQYHNKPKAQATIDLFADELLASGILLDIQSAYSLDSNQDVWDPPFDVWDPPGGDEWDPAITIDAAAGVQLDVLGKYEGIDRFYRELTLVDYFSLETYTESAPTSPPRYGFTDYAHYDTTPPKGTLTYGTIISTNNRLLDDAFREIIKLKILQNYLNHSNGAIDAGIYHFFGLTVRPEEMYNMHMVYFITAAVTPLILATIYKKLLPRPMGVGSVIVNNVTGLMFGMTDYGGYESPFAYGFSVYSNYDTLPGLDLTYSQISVG